MKRGFKIIFVFLILCVLSQISYADITSCGDVTTSDNVTQNLTCSGNALNITANNVVLDCNGHTLTGDGTGYGIYSSSVSNITIKNCIIRSFDKNLFFDQTTNSQAYNNTLSNSTQESLDLFLGSHNNTIYNTTINSSSTGIRTYGNQTTIRDTTITAVSTALDLSGVKDSILERNTIISSTFYAVYDSAFFNTTLTNNSIISDGFDALVTNSNNSLFRGNNITSTVSSAISISGFNLIIDSNKLNSTSGNGIFTSSGGNFTITNNIVNSSSNGIELNVGIGNSTINGNNCSITGGGSGIDIASDNNTISGNIVHAVISNGVEIRGEYNNATNNIGIVSGLSTAVGILIESSNSYFYNNTGYSNESYGIVLQNSYNNLLINNTAIVDYNATLPYPSTALALAVGVANNTFINTTATAPIARGIWLSDVFGNTQNNTFINTTIETNTTWLILDSNAFNNTFQRTTFKKTEGSITILENITLPDSVNITVEKLNIGQNYSFLNSTNLTFFNTSAEITLNGINYSSPEIIVDYADNGTFLTCSSPECNITSYIGGVITFNVSHFTNYSVQEANSTNCGNVTQSLTLTQSVNSTGTCFTILSNNIILDCNGFDMIYAENETGYAINATGVENITIKNCNIIQDLSNQTDSHSIYFIGTNNSNIINSTTKTTGQSTLGLVFGQSNNNILQELLINSTGTVGVSEYGARFFESNNNTIQDSQIFATGGSIGFEIVSSNSSKLMNLNVTSEDAAAINANIVNNLSINYTVINSTNAVGISVATGTELQLYNNYAEGVGGFSISDVSNLKFVNNTGVDRFGNAGIFLATVINSILDSNRGYGDSGINVVLNSNQNNFTNTIASGNGFGLLIVNSYSNDFQNTTINNTADPGFFIPSASLSIFSFGLPTYNNTFNNTVINGLRAISLVNSAENNTLINTVIRANETWIYTDSTIVGNTIQNTTFSTSETNLTYAQNITIPTDVNLTIERLNITKNRVFLNSTNASFLNITAKIIFTNLTTPSSIPLIDESDSGTLTECPSTICQNITTGTTFSMDVTHFTTYSSMAGGVTLTLEKTDSQDPISPGSQLNYTVNVNVTSGTAINLTLMETYPSEVTFDNATPAPTSGNNTWSIGNLTAGQTYQINITVNVSGTASGTITNTVNITYQNSTNNTISGGVQENTTITTSSPAPSGGGGGGGGGSGSAICPPFCKYPENANLPVCRNNCITETPQISNPTFPITTKNIQEKVEQTNNEPINEAEIKEEPKEEQKIEEITQEIPHAKYKLPDNLLYYIFFIMAGLGIIFLLLTATKRDKPRKSRKN